MKRAEDLAKREEAFVKREQDLRNREAAVVEREEDVVKRNETIMERQVCLCPACCCNNCDNDCNW